MLSSESAVPLEKEPTAALTLTFTGVPVIELETLGFSADSPG